MVVVLAVLGAAFSLCLTFFQIDAHEQEQAETRAEIQRVGRLHQQGLTQQRQIMYQRAAARPAATRPRGVSRSAQAPPPSSRTIGPPPVTAPIYRPSGAPGKPPAARPSAKPRRAAAPGPTTPASTVRAGTGKPAPPAPLPRSQPPRKPDTAGQPKPRAPANPTGEPDVLPVPVPTR